VVGKKRVGVNHKKHKNAAEFISHHESAISHYTRYSHLGCCITLSRTSFAKYTGPKFSAIMSLKTTGNDQNQETSIPTYKNGLSINQPSP
jgi:hypothetical protein